MSRICSYFLRRIVLPAVSGRLPEAGPESVMHFGCEANMIDELDVEVVGAGM